MAEAKNTFVGLQVYTETRVIANKIAVLTGMTTSAVVHTILKQVLEGGVKAELVFADNEKLFKSLGGKSGQN